jgi:hypothetical protein
MNTFASAQILLISIVLLVAGISKLIECVHQTRADRTALAILLGGQVRSARVWRLIAAIEAMVGLAMLVLPSLRAPVVVAAAIMVGATTYSAWALRKAPDRPYGCFGGG